MLEIIGQYAPHCLYAEITSECTDLGEVWELIREYYGVGPSEASFLDFYNIKPEENERQD